MRLALAQIISTDDCEANLAIVEKYSTDAHAQGAELVVFPEATMRAFGGSLADIAEPVDGPWATAVRSIATRLRLTIVVGMFTPGAEGRVRNTLLVAGPDAVVSYDKVHLFDAFGFAESDTVEAGDRAVTVAVGGTTIGLATCYDLRFPALFAANAAAGARLSIVCASWGAGPGKAEQWDLLVRARAVDTTTFVIAVGQGDPGPERRAATGAAPTGIGRSAVVSPFGEILHQLGGEEGLLVVDVDPGELDAVRQKLPVLANRRLGLE